MEWREGERKWVSECQPRLWVIRGKVCVCLFLLLFLFLLDSDAMMLYIVNEIWPKKIKQTKKPLHSVL